MRGRTPPSGSARAAGAVFLKPQKTQKSAEAPWLLRPPRLLRFLRFNPIGAGAPRRWRGQRDPSSEPLRGPPSPARGEGFAHDQAATFSATWNSASVLALIS